VPGGDPGALPAGSGALRAGGGLGVLGGTFNPPHRGHVELACHALRELGLARVLVVPARVSPGKALEDDPGPERRLEMCRLAVEGVEGVEVCALEVERDGPSYTAATLRALHAAHPNTALTFILGADAAATLPTWHEASELPALACFAVALRAGGPPIAAPEPVGFPPRGWRSQLEGPSFSIAHLHMPVIEVSSSLVRERLRRGLPVEDLVGPAVAAYIAAHVLYRASIGAANS
jgi:nicotinate-nucleotide adenylyltransferase